MPSIMSKAMSQIFRAWLAALLGQPATIRYASPDMNPVKNVSLINYLTDCLHFVNSVLVTKEVKKGVHVVEQLHNLVYCYLNKK